MPNDSPTKSPTDSQQWKPPTGIYYERNSQRPKTPFLLRWKDSAGKHSKSFATEAEREKEAKRLADLTVEHGKSILDFDPREWRRWQEFKLQAGGNDPLDILREWKAIKGESASPITVSEAVTEYLGFRADGKLSADTLRHFDKHLKERFAAEFGAMKLRDVNAELVRNWLKGLRHPRTGDPMEPVTKRHHRKDLTTFLDYCSRVRGWIPRNPCDAVAVPAVEEKDVELLTVEEGRALFAANEGKRVVGRLALEAFGFLRASRAGRQQLAEVNFEKRGLRLRGVGTKSDKTRFRQGHPDNLWAWLCRAPDEMWGMKWWEYRNEKRIAFAAAGMEEGSGNRLRRTCISAHLAWKKDPAMTSYLAQHSTLTMTEKYEGIMAEADGLAWFRIGPRFIP